VIFMFMVSLFLIGVLITLLCYKQQNTCNERPIVLHIENEQNTPNITEHKNQTHDAYRLATRNTMKQIGLLTAQGDSVTKPVILPLYGRRTYNGSSRWQYWAYSQDYTSWKIPVIYNGRSCSEIETGCDEIFDGDMVTVPSYEGIVFKSTLYKPGGLQYSPDVFQ
jgi:hypothetical protein